MPVTSSSVEPTGHAPWPSETDVSDATVDFTLGCHVSVPPELSQEADADAVLFLAGSDGAHPVNVMDEPTVPDNESQTTLERFRITVSVVVPDDPAKVASPT